jgi:plasmid maintenance system killer protein
MSYEFDDSDQRTRFDKSKHVSVSSSSMRKYHDWRRLIVDQNYSPKDAASAVGDSHYEQLKGKKFETYPIYSIRLNQTDRVTFIYPSSNSIKIINIGGHY